MGGEEGEKEGMEVKGEGEEGQRVGREMEKKFMYI